MLSRPAYIVSEFCLIGFIYSSLITEELFSSPGAFVHCEIEVSSHCICITGNLRQNIIPNITQTPHRCCFIVSLLAQLSHAQSALFLFSLYCQTFNHKTTQEVLLNGLNLVFWKIFFSNFACTDSEEVFHRGKITHSEEVITGQTAKCLLSSSLLGYEDKGFFFYFEHDPFVVYCERNSHLQILFKHMGTQYHMYKAVYVSTCLHCE